MKKAIRLLHWIAFNGLFVWLAWQAVINNVTGAANVLIFVTWFCVLVYWITASSSELCKKAQDKERNVPAWVSHGIDIAMIAFLIWHGWWITGIGILLLTSAECAIYNKQRNP